VGTLWDERFASLGQRDSENSLDPTLFRMYSSGQGRWLSPDPIGGDTSNPQSLNRYAYVLNNPTNLIDPLGLQWITSGANPADPCNDFQFAISHAQCPRIPYPGVWCVGGYCPPFPPGGSTGGGGGGGVGNAQNGGNPPVVTCSDDPPGCIIVGGSGGLDLGKFADAIEDLLWKAGAAYARGTDRVVGKSLRRPGESIRACTQRIETAVLGSTGKGLLDAATFGGPGILTHTAPLFPYQVLPGVVYKGSSLLEIYALEGSGFWLRGAQVVSGGVTKVVAPLTATAVGIQGAFVLDCR
jgi:RHS repeat-associated protein